jgi:uroporphyrin-III C-methyltransferase
MQEEKHIKSISQKTISNNDKCHHHKFLLFVLFFLLVLSFACSVFVFWQQSKESKFRTNSALAQKNLETTVSKVQWQSEQQQQVITNLSLTLAQLNQAEKERVVLGRLTKVYYLVEAAQFSLNTEKNLKAAIQLLTTAQQSLIGMREPLLLNVNDALTQDLAMLRKTQNFDVADLVLRLEALSAQLNVLKDMPKKTPSQQDIAVKVDSVATMSPEKETRWQTCKRFWRDFLTLLKPAFVIRYQQQTMPPVIESPQQVALILSMQLKLQVAELALLQQHQDVYLSNLQGVEEILKKYFSAYSLDQVGVILNSLRDLKKVDFKVLLPSLVASENVIQAAFKQIYNVAN